MFKVMSLVVICRVDWGKQSLKSGRLTGAHAFDGNGEGCTDVFQKLTEVSSKP